MCLRLYKVKAKRITVADNTVPITGLVLLYLVLVAKQLLIFSRNPKRCGHEVVKNMSLILFFFTPSIKMPCIRLPRYKISTRAYFLVPPGRQDCTH